MKYLNSAIARAARAYTGTGQAELAKIAGVASRTVFKLEDDGRITPESLEKILTAFETKGVLMVYDDRGAVVGLSFVKIES